MLSVQAQEQSMRIHTTTLKTGINRTPEFEKKGLALFAVNVGTKCGHGCTYCSTGALLRMHPSFKAVGENPFGHGYSIVDPDTPERVARDAKRIKERGLIQLCTTVDAWAPEAQTHNIGRRCLEAILAEPGWTVRILTKNAAVARDFDLIEKHRDRVLVSLSLTAAPESQAAISVIEPNASPISERIAVMREAHARGLRTYGMLCPLLPGIADSAADIDALVRLAVEFGAEEIFVEPVNARGPGLKQTQEVLALHGFGRETAAVEIIRHKKGWSRYVADLIAKVQESIRAHSDITKLRFLLYPSPLTKEDVHRIRHDDAGVIWLGKESPRHEQAS
jgi:DNA repair photolyase